MPHKRVPAVATSVAQVLRFSWLPTTHGKITFDFKYWINTNINTTPIGYHNESLVVKAIETAIAALMNIPI